MGKRFTPPVAISIMAVSACVSVGLCLFAPTLATNANKAIVDTLPESGGNHYLESLQAKDYQSIYSQLNQANPTLNTYDGFTHKLESVYADYDVNQLSVAKSDDPTKMYVTYDNKIIHDLSIVKTDQGYVGIPVFEDSKEYVIEVPTGSSLSINGFSVPSSSKTTSDTIATVMDGINDTYYPDVVSMDRYTVTNLYELESMEVNNQACDIMQDVVSKTYYCGKDVTSSDLNDWVFAAAKAIAAYPAKEGSVGAVANYVLSDSDFYQAYRTMENTWFTAHNSAVFSNETLINAIDIGNDNLLVQLAMDYLVSSSSGSKNYHIGFQMALYPTGNGYKIAGFGVDSTLNDAYKGVSYD